MSPRFVESFEDYPYIPSDFYNSLWLYFNYGIEPGGFGMAVLHNDFCGAVTRAHPVLTVESMRDLAKWLYNCAPTGSWGSPALVKEWQSKADLYRRDALITCDLRPSVIDVLKGERA